MEQKAKMACLKKKIVILQPLCKKQKKNHKTNIFFSSQENPVEFGHSLPKGGATMIFDFSALHNFQLT